ncbi:hypothetical protein AQUCO_00700638v1 [Aquilegia coerulea]|uniref:Uncharacterized protein n=1 Tax=Aquilegia coerulea TaxID=218851 RepID=A0A2G5EL62_AQUCA|nr:hypothetical protein AQUCO_00700638v1 [Aquilegia coerulea]
MKCYFQHLQGFQKLNNLIMWIDKRLYEVILYANVVFFLFSLFRLWLLIFYPDPSLFKTSDCPYNGAVICLVILLVSFLVSSLAAITLKWISNYKIIDGAPQVLVRWWMLRTVCLIGIAFSHFCHICLSIAALRRDGIAGIFLSLLQP